MDLFALLLILTIGSGPTQTIVKGLEVSQAECELQRPRVEDEVLTHSGLARIAEAQGNGVIAERDVKVSFGTECVGLK